MRIFTKYKFAWVILFLVSYACSIEAILYMFTGKLLFNADPGLVGVRMILSVVGPVITALCTIDDAHISKAGKSSRQQAMLDAISLLESQKDNITNGDYWPLRKLIFKIAD